MPKKATYIMAEEAIVKENQIKILFSYVDIVAISCLFISHHPGWSLGIIGVAENSRNQLRAICKNYSSPETIGSFST
jgi:hypothetical protein